MNNTLSLALCAFLLTLVGGNFFLFYHMSNYLYSSKEHYQITGASLSTTVDYLQHLPPQYKTKNIKYESIQHRLYKHHNDSVNSVKVGVWPDLDKWTESSELQYISYILHKMKTANITYADNARRGTQLKLLFELEGDKYIYFKPKRYSKRHIINGNIYAGYDRHNSEVLGYYLAVVLNYKWIAPSVIRRVNIAKEIVPVATVGLRKTMINKGASQWCVYGKCYYCKINETVCGDNANLLEGAAILHLRKDFSVRKSPWRRSYNSIKMKWETDDNYCKQVKIGLNLQRILDLIEISIFDFLIQNGDRHRYELYKDKIILLDNGKGLGNPYRDELDILAPLYQCCMIRYSTWRHLELLSGGVVTETVKTLSSMQGEVLATEDHYVAIERRLLRVYAVVQSCIGKFGSASVFK